MKQKIHSPQLTYLVMSVKCETKHNKEHESDFLSIYFVYAWCVYLWLRILFIIHNKRFILYFANYCCCHVVQISLETKTLSQEKKNSIYF